MNVCGKEKEKTERERGEEDSKREVQKLISVCCSGRQPRRRTADFRHEPKTAQLHPVRSAESMSDWLFAIESKSLSLELFI